MTQGFSMYTRTCRRCKEYFKTPCKLGKICEECKKPQGGGRKWGKYCIGKKQWTKKLEGL